MKLILAALSNVLIFSYCIAQPQIKIDGITSDWNKDNFNYSKNYNITYCIYSNNNLVYFLFKFHDKQAQLKVLRNGLEIKIDTLGKNTFQSSIIFPYNVDRENNDPLSHSYTGINPKTEIHSSKNELLKNSNKIKLNGFKNGLNDVMINLNNSINVYAALQFDSTNTLNYELAIPINLILESNISKYKSAFNFQFNLMGLPNHKSDNTELNYFENNTINQKMKLLVDK